MLKRKRLNSILSGVTKIQKQLEIFTTETADNLSINANKIAQLESDREELKAQATKASTVYANLNTLLGE